MYMCSCKLRGIIFPLPGGPRLKAEDVVLHLKSIIKEPKYQGYVHVCVEYCKLLKNILSVQVHQSDITVKTWQGIVKKVSRIGSLHVLVTNKILI